MCCARKTATDRVILDWQVYFGLYRRHVCLPVVWLYTSCVGNIRIRIFSRLLARYRGPIPIRIRLSCHAIPSSPPPLHTRAMGSRFSNRSGRFTVATYGHFVAKMSSFFSLFFATFWFSLFSTAWTLGRFSACRIVGNKTICFAQAYTTIIECYTCYRVSINYRSNISAILKHVQYGHFRILYRIRC